MTGNWLSILSILLVVLSLYFSLTFLQYLKSDDARIVGQSKFAAVFCLAAGLLIPAFYGLVME